VRGGGTEISRFGSSEHGLDFGMASLPVPNVVAAVRRAAVPAAKPSPPR
jgi:hypothetical protein